MTFNKQQRINSRCLVIIIVGLMLQGCFITTIGGHRNASPLGKNNFNLNARGIAVPVSYAGVLDLHYGITDYSDIGTQFIYGVTLGNAIVRGIGFEGNKSFKGTDLAFSAHANIFTYNRLAGVRIVKGLNDYISYELNYTNLFESDYVFINSISYGFSKPNGLTVEFGISFAGLDPDFSPVLGVGYNFTTK